MMPTTASQLCAAVNGTLYGDGALLVDTLSTDSRSIAAGAWFVPLTGERFDGHDYIPMALEKGASGCFCARLPQELRPDKTYILVENTKAALPYPRGTDYRQHGENHLEGTAGRRPLPTVLYAENSREP